MKEHLLLASALSFSATATGAMAADDVLADDSIIVTASRSSDGIENDMLGASATLLSAEDLQNRQTVIVSDILRDVPGVAVNRGGTFGSLTSVRIRGAEGNHTLMMIDGIEASDPAGGIFDFGSLFADEGARIEVLRGEQSALYGSDAIGGVVHYITASGKERAGNSLIVEGGSMNTWRAGARAAGVNGRLDYAITGSFFETDGFVVAPEGSRKMTAGSRNLSAKLGYELGDVKLRAVGRYNRTRADTNDQDYVVTGNAIDAGGEYEGENIYGLIGAEFSATENWKHDVSIQRQSSDRDMFDDNGGLIRGSLGRRTRASWVSSLNFGSSGRISHDLTSAVDYERETYRNAGPVNALNPLQAIKSWGFVAQYQASVRDKGTLIMAVRHDANSRFKDATSWRASASWKLTPSTRLHGAAGTGVKAPTFAELYGYSPTANYVGNPNLTVETSHGWELGIDQKLFGDAVSIDVTYFSAKLTDQIIDLYTPIYTSVNASGKTPHKGVEVAASANLGAGFSLNGQYTHVSAQDEFGTQLIRRPRNLASGNLLWQAADGAGSINLNVRHNGEMLDTNFATYITAPLKAFTLVNLSGDVRLSGAIRLHARVENLLNQDYVENVGYLSPGRAAYVGFRANF
jgi:vitamin B12 transporter